MHAPAWLFWTAIVVTPLIAATQRYAVAYGYEGFTKAHARDQFKWTAIGVAVFFCLPIAVAYLCE